MKTWSISRSLFSNGVAAILAGVLFGPLAAQAADKFWVCGSDQWDNSTCWNPTGQPQDGDSVFLTQSDATNRTVSYLNTLYPTAVLSTFQIDATGSGTMTLSQSQDSLAAGDEFIGYSGNGAFVQSGGTHTVTYYLLLGNNSTGNGSYTLSGTGSLSAGYEYIGVYGTGAFTQTGGTNTVSFLGLGNNSTGNGSYDLSGTGSLSAGYEYIGYSGAGVFTQSGGTNTVSNYLYLGTDSTGNGTYNLSGTGSLSAYNEVIGTYGTGAFNQSGGTHTVTNTLYLGDQGGSSGTYNLTGGTLNVGGIVRGAGTSAFNWSAGNLNFTVDTLVVGTNGVLGATLDLDANKNLSAPVEIIGARGIVNHTGGTNTVAYNLTINGIYNLSGTVLSGGTLVVNGYMDNSGTLALAGGTLTGSATLVNNNLVSGFGTIGGSGGFVNNALLTQNGGHITLTNTGANANYGNIDLATPYQLRLNGADLSNSGTLNLNSAVVTGTGTLNNTYGGVIAGRGTISSNFNNSGGVVAVTSGTTNITKPFSNSGAIQLGGPTASLTGGTITSTGTIEGVGSVGNSIGNAGIVRAGAGTLTLSGASVSNNVGGLMNAPSGGTILAANGMSANAGTVNLTGGTFDNNNHAMTSTGQISGYGTLRTGGLSNSGSMTLTGGTTTVNGNVTNEVGANLKVAHNPAIFTGNVVNDGTVKTTNTTVTFAGSYTENGVFISDPSNNYFTDVVIGANGYWTGGAGDNFFISGNFVNNSLQNLLWNTDAASLFLNGSGLQNLYLAGSDLGALFSGYNNNFAWGDFSLGSGVSAHLWDGNADSGAALYVGLVELGGGISQLSSISSDYNIYYNPNAAGNAYLGGLKYALNGAGFLAPAVPIPPAVWLFGSGLLGLVGIARRKARPTRTAHRNVKAGHAAGVTRRTYMSE